MASLQSLNKLISKYKKVSKTVDVPMSYDFLVELKDYLDSVSTSNVGQASGWAVYQDTQYTTGSPFTLTQAAGQVAVPNNAGNSIETYLPSGMTSFYDGTKLVGLEGNAYVIAMEIGVRPTSAASSPRINVVIDIGGAVGEIYPRDFTMSKGNGVDHFFLSSFVYYTLNTFEANGGIVKIEALGSDVEIFDIRYVISLQHANKLS